MKNGLSRLFATIVLLFISFSFAAAQGPWPNDESEKLYYKGRDFLSAGQIESAINTYQQAMALAPDKMIIQRDLGKAYYYGKRYDEALKVLDNVLNSNDADDQVYQLMADCRSARGERKKARSTFMEGIERFPNSGLLYHELGKFYEDEAEDEEALNIWLDGIRNAPDYFINYYEAAYTYMSTSKVIWVILYGEIFVNKETETMRSNEIRKIILNAYKKLFSTNTADFPELRGVYGPDASDFERAVFNTYLKLSPIMNDGFSIENMTILRTRFLIEWNAHYADAFPFSLFSYQDAMIKNGDFDAYNQWLLGKAINETDYKTWSSNNATAIDHFLKFRDAHPLKSLSTDFYNNKNFKHLFSSTRH